MEGRGGGLARRSKEGKRDVDTSVEGKSTRARRHSKRKKGEGRREGGGSRDSGFGSGDGGRTQPPHTCIDIHSKGVLLVRHQAVSVILGHDAEDVILQFGVEVEVDSSDVGNDSARLCGFQHAHCLDRVEELGAGVIDVVDQDGDGGRARQGNSAPVGGHHCQPVGLLLFSVDGDIANADDSRGWVDEEAVLSPGLYSVHQLAIEATVLIRGCDLKD